MYWYEEDIAELEKRKSTYSYQPRMACYGSSSIRLWDNLDHLLQCYHPVNLGFGGSTLEACVFYFDRVFMHLQPEAMLVYAGDNDLGDGRTVEQVFASWKLLVAKIEKRFGNIPVSFISIKPSIARSHLAQSIVQTNSLIRQHIAGKGNPYTYVDIHDAMLDENKMPCPEYFVEDGLHLSEKGYAVWEDILRSYIAENKMLMPEKTVPC